MTVLNVKIFHFYVSDIKYILVDLSAPKNMFLFFFSVKNKTQKYRRLTHIMSVAFRCSRTLNESAK